MNSAAIATSTVPQGAWGEVHDFWNREACGSHFVEKKTFTPEFYEEYRKFRYSTERHLTEIVPFSDTAGKRVLEIGCGNGADGTLFAQAGADYTGVDLTEAAVQATRRHFEILGLKGTFQLEDAEQLSFPSDSFDFAYSHGVLHHTPHPQRAFDEVYRVLKPGGGAVIMLYHKHSFNYYARIMGYMRLKVLLGRAHREAFSKYGWSYLKAKNFVHHATDGEDCPFAYVYTRQSAKKAFSRFSSFETKVRHFPLAKYSARFPLWTEKLLARTAGWYLFIFLTK